MQNDDDKCFLWCVLRAIYPINCNKYRISDFKKYLSELNISMLSFPVDYLDRKLIKLFEEANNLRITKIHIDHANKQCYPIYVSDNIKVATDRTVDIGFLEFYNKRHLCLNN
jgi:hypothetical protein